MSSHPPSGSSPYPYDPAGRQPWDPAAAPVGGSGGRRDPASAVLLILAAVLSVVGSFLTLVKSDGSLGIVTDGVGEFDFHAKWTTWRSVFESGYGDSDTQVQLTGVPLVVGAVFGLIAAGLLAAGPGARSRVVRAVGTLSAGALVGVTLVVALSGASSTLGGSEFSETTLGAGFWTLVVAAGVSLGALLVGLIAGGGQAAGSGPGQPPVDSDAGASGADIWTAVLLALLALVVAVGSFLSLLADISWTAWSIGDADHSSVQLPGVALLVAALFALVAAVPLFAGFGARRPVGRALGSAAAGMIFGVTLGTIFTVLSATVANDDLSRIGAYGPGFWVMLLATMLSVVTLASSLVSCRTPRPLAYSPTAHHHSPGAYYSPPNGPAGQTYYGAAPQPGQPMLYTAQPGDGSQPGYSTPYPTHTAPYPPGAAPQPGHGEHHPQAEPYQGYSAPQPGWHPGEPASPPSPHQGQPMPQQAQPWDTDPPAR
ncbi:hypothetical protein [Nocardia jejuensis]|uniref:hypothetical protein n=1 Tax=Nocardia jejuensis TaxID=328049 RepID=UPI000833563B|nr:hypothetical protein [Nocardia jejuensis]